MAAAFINSSNSMITDIKEFLLNENETLICSDYEGTLPIAQIQKFVEFASTEGKQVIYLGDIFDNTSKCAKDSNDNLCSLKILKLLIDNPSRSRYVVGNRDINKIKLIPLLQYKNGEKWWHTPVQPPVQPPERSKWKLNNATHTKWVKNNKMNKSKISVIPEIKDVYIDIAVKLINTMNDSPTNIWKDETMKDYIPFWSNKKPKELDYWLSGKYIDKMTSLYERFVRIFGLDTVIGTMSADTILTGIPNELFPNEINNIIELIKAKITYKDKLIATQKAHHGILEEIQEGKKGKLVDMKDDNILNFEIRSAIVFTVFMRMLDKSLFIENLSDRQKKTEINSIDGYLWKYLTTAAPALYAKTETELLLFSHGGVTNDFIKTDSLTILQSPDIDWEKVLKSTTKVQPLGEDKQTASTPDDIIKSINDYKDKYFKILSKCFNTFNESSVTINKDLMILLAISAPAENNIELFEKYTTSSFTPIQPKKPKSTNLSIKGNTLKIYSFWGHASICFGYGFKKVNENMYYICTDLSASLYKESICGNVYNENNLNLIIKYNKSNQLFSLSLIGLISIDNKFIANVDDKTKTSYFFKDSTIDNILNGTLEKQDGKIKDKRKFQLIVVNNKMVDKIDENGMKLSVNQTTNNMNDDTFFKKDTYNTTSTNLANPDFEIDYIYNGDIEYNGEKYELFSYFNFEDKKRILILNKSGGKDINFILGDTVPFGNAETALLFGGFRKNLSIHKSKKSNKNNRKYKTKDRLYKKSKQLVSKKNRKNKTNKK